MANCMSNCMPNNMRGSMNNVSNMQSRMHTNMPNDMQANMQNAAVKTRPSCPTDRKSIMMEIYRCGFIMDELRLYLDTHPEDKAALECFNEARRSYFEAVEMHTKLFGPILVSIYEPESVWSWNKGPMPWEGEV